MPKLELAVSSDQVEKVTEAIIRAAKTGEIGDGKIFMSDLDQACVSVLVRPTKCHLAGQPDGTPGFAKLGTRPPFGTSTTGSSRRSGIRLDVRKQKCAVLSGARAHVDMLGMGADPEVLCGNLKGIFAAMGAKNGTQKRCRDA